MMVRRWTTPT